MSGWTEDQLRDMDLSGTSHWITAIEDDAGDALLWQVTPLRYSPKDALQIPEVFTITLEGAVATVQNIYLRTNHRLQGNIAFITVTRAEICLDCNGMGEFSTMNPFGDETTHPCTVCEGRGVVASAS